MRWLGHETVGFCEIDEWSRRVLDKHWPEVPKHDDIRTYEPGQFGPIDLVTGGFPCQPFSVAGQRRGSEDDRHLWPEMARIIEAERPRYVLGENVAGIVNMALDGVLADLESIGYTARAVVIPAGAVNALHRRDRVWILAHRNGVDAGQQEPVSGSTHTAWQPQPQGADGQERGRADDGSSVAADTGSERLEGQQQAGAEKGAAIRSGSGAQAARALDFSPDGLSPELVRSRWADGSWELDLPRTTTDESDRKQKIMAAGNAIVPQVAYEILKVMIGEAGEGDRST